MRSRHAVGAGGAGVGSKTAALTDPLPLVSIVTPTLNRMGWLEDTVRSVASQTYQAIEHIVVDGGSTDGTQDYLGGLPSDRLRWISEPDTGMYDAINKGLAMSHGEIVAYLNSDDLYLPWAVQTAVDQFLKDPASDLVYGDAIRVLVDEGRILPWFQAPVDRAWLLRRESLIQPTVFWRRGVIDDIGHFDTTFRNAGDLDYWLRAAREHRMVRVDELLAIDRWHSDVLSATFAGRLAAEDREVRRRNGGLARAGARVAGRIRSALLRRLLWLRFVSASRRNAGGWPMTSKELRPRISLTAALKGLLPGRPAAGWAATQWSKDPVNLARDGLAVPQE